MGESACWIAWTADRPWRFPVFTIERTAAKRSRPQSERNPFVTFRKTVLMRMACALALLVGAMVASSRKRHQWSWILA